MTLLGRSKIEGRDSAQRSTFGRTADIPANDAESAIKHVKATLAGDIAAHIADATDAHDASAISVADVGGLYAATQVEAALAEVMADLNADEAALAAHIGDASDAHDASAISILDAGGYYAGNEVEAALQSVGQSFAALSGIYQSLDGDLTSWSGVTRAANFDTFTATPSSANLRALLSDESGTGAAYFQGGDVGTPSAGVLTNCAGLPVGAGLTQGSARSVIGVTGNATANHASIQGAARQILAVNAAGTALAFTDPANLPFATTSYAPTVTSTSGTITTVTIVSAAYMQLGPLIFVRHDFILTTIGSGGGGFLDITVPITFSGVVSSAYSEVNNGTGEAFTSPTSGTVLRLKLYNNTATAAANNRWIGGSILLV